MPAIHLLNDAAVRGLTKPGRHADGGNLYLVVYPSGAKNWVFLYSDPVLSRRIELGLGGYPFTSLKQARNKAAWCRDLLNEQPPRSPFKVKQEQRRVASMPTFEELATDYVASNADSWKSEDHHKQIKAKLEKWCRPIADKRINEVTIDDVRGIIEAYAKEARNAALRLRATIAQIFDNAITLGHLDRNARNPADLGSLISKAPKAEHHPAMPHADVPTFVQQLRAQRQDLGIPAYAMEFIVLTATRLGETSKATWTEFDRKNKVWNIPAKRMKAGVPHIVPLTDAMIEILDAMEAIKTSEFVFPGARAGAPLNNKTFERLLLRCGAKVTTHGFRTAFSTFARNDAEFPFEIVERALAHKVGDKTSQAYWREPPVDKHRKLYAAWSNYLAGRSNVVAIRAA